MLELFQEIVDNGKVLGCGSSRVAVEYEGVVYKFPINEDGFKQASIEEHIYDLLKDEFQHMFPQTSFLDNYVVKMEKVDILGEEDDYRAVEDVLFADYEDRDKIDNWIDSLTSFSTAVYNLGGSSADLLENVGNVGFIGEALKVVDWGYPQYDCLNDISPTPSSESLNIMEYVNKVIYGD